MERVTGASSSAANFPPRIMYSLSAVAVAIVLPTPETATAIVSVGFTKRGRPTQPRYHAVLSFTHTL
ncbi:MAG: hypothetical protein GU356_00070 [Pyrobaculum sp.]|nr:hypothetical protein [Pyrobaculum sp.]